MTRNRVSLALDREALARFERLLGSRPIATGAHCGDDDGDDGVTSCLRGSIALGAHCGDDDDDG